MNNKFYKIIIRVIFCFIVIYSIYSFCFIRIIKGDYPCDCESDRVIELNDPLMKGEDVKTLQKRLKELDYYQGDIDGVYGFLTYIAVKDFQKFYKLESDGIVREDTWGMLGTLSDSIITSRKGKPPQGQLSIVINLYNRVLIIYSDGKPYKKYSVTIGKKETPTPVGEWYIKNKYKRIDNGPLGSRWMGLNIPWGVYGIHGTNKPWEIGTAASKGCIRLHNRNVEELFDWIEPHTRVKIVGEKPEVIIDKLLKSGDTGYDVMKLQEKLREVRYYHGYLDGTYSTETGNAIREMESQFGLKVDGIADYNIYNLLKIKYSF